MIQRFKSLKIGLLLAAFVVAAVWVLVTSLQARAEDEDLSCSESLAAYAWPIVEEYRTFLNQYTLANVPSSEQVETSMAYYRAVKEGIEGVHTHYSRIEEKSGATLNELDDELSRCLELRDEFLEFSGWLLTEYALKSAGSKQSFAVVDGLKAVNDSLEDLSDDFSRVFPQLFTKMDNALPCYASQCISL